MKILLIRPRQSGETIGLQHVMIVEPLELEVIAATVEPSDDVRIIDMIIEKEDITHHLKSYNPDVVGVTGYITNVPQMKAYSKAAKSLNPGVTTIVGGVYVEKFPEDVEDDAIDFRVVRNATRTFPKLIDHLKGNGEKPNGILAKGEVHVKEALPDYDFYFPMPRRDLTRHYHDKYFYVFHNRVALIKTSFGCPYKCDFCYCRFITDDHYHARPVEDVLDELESIEQKEIYIIDDDFLLSRKRMTEFFAGLRERHIEKKYLVYGRADFIVENPDIIEEFKSLGLRTVIVGLESFSDDELYTYNKQSDATTNEKAMNVLNRYHVDCYAAMILSPDWDKERFKLTGEKLISLGIRFINLQPLTPLPGISMEVDEDKLIISRKDYDKWDLAHIAIMPEKMCIEEYYMEIIKLYDKVTFYWKFTPGYMKYGLFLFVKVLSGALRVRTQYKKRYREAKK